MSGSFFQGLISGINQGITSARAENQKAAEAEIKQEQDILSELMQNSLNPEIQTAAGEALLNIHQSGKPVGFLAKLMSKRGTNPEMAKILEMIRNNKGSLPPSPQEADPAAVPPPAIPPPPPLSSDIPAEGVAGDFPPTGVLAAPLEGQAAQPVGNTQQPLNRSFTGVARSAPNVSSTPPAPSDFYPPGLGILNPLQKAKLEADLRNTRVSSTGNSLIIREIADLTEEEALTRAQGGVFPVDKTARLKALREAMRVEWSARDAAGATAKRDEITARGEQDRLTNLAGPDRRPLAIQADAAKAAGDMNAYRRIIGTIRDAGLADDSPRQGRGPRFVATMDGPMLVNDDGTLSPATRIDGTVVRGQLGKPATGAERKELVYFNRMATAAEDIAAVEDTVAKMDLGAQTWMEWMPNFLQTQAGQKYKQAQRAFTEARLRQESGAAIAPHEYENDRLTYFVQPGDTPETLAQKKRAAYAILATRGYGTGKALAEYYGADEAEALLQDFRSKAAREGDKPKPVDKPKVTTSLNPPSSADAEAAALAVKLGLTPKAKPKG